MTLSTHLITDNLNSYHPYTREYRKQDSLCYRDFSIHDPRNSQSLVNAAEAFHWPGNRKALSSSVMDYLVGFGAPEEALANANALADKNTVVIVAGHQPGLMGGSLFLTFKILSVLRTCDILNALESPIRFVPLYWNGSEDHNLSEFGRVTVFDQDHDLKSFNLPALEGTPMSCQTGVEVARSLLGELTECLPATEFRDGVVRQLDLCLQDNLGSSMSRLMLEWFGKRGLLVVEPQIFRSAGAPILVEALRDFQELSRHMATDHAQMVDRGYQPPLPLQVNERTLVYYLAPKGHGGRTRIRCDRDDDSYFTEDGQMNWDLASLMSQLSEHPEQFGPSAALRPIVQGTVLPVIAYVAGGGELAYHLQIRSLFSHLNVQMPMLLPRVAGTIIKKSLLKGMAKFNLGPDDLLSPGWEWEKVVERSTTNGSVRDNAFARLNENLQKELRSLSEALAKAGHSQLSELSREWDKFSGRLEGVKRRLESQDPVVGSDAKRQYYRLRKFILPREGLQELSVSTIYFLTLFGPEWLEQLGAQVDPFSSAHHLFTVE